MFSEIQIKELQKLHKAHIANTLLFAGKILDQQRRITDAQVDALHETLMELAGSNVFDPQQDPASMAQHVMTSLTAGLSGQSSRANNLSGNIADAYRSIMAMAMEYGNDTFTHFQNMAGKSNASASASSLPMGSWKSWSEIFSKAAKESSDLFADNMQTMARSIPVPESTGNASHERSTQNTSRPASKSAGKA